MKALGCEREFEVARAARTGFWPGELRQHAEACPACAETFAVTAALFEGSAGMRAAQPPDAAHAWLEARRRARLHLRHRALGWFRTLRILALVYLPMILVWILSQHAFGVHAAWTPSLGTSFRADFSALLTGPAEMVALSGALLAAVCIFMGSWYLLREARTPLHS